MIFAGDETEKRTYSDASGTKSPFSSALVQVIVDAESYIVDLSGVLSSAAVMGQGFADEVFRVFQNQHPEIELIPHHANATVLGMVRHMKR